MESYNGSIETLQDAMVLLHASRLGLIVKVDARLNMKQREEIRDGSIFIWEEKIGFLPEEPYDLKMPPILRSMLKFCCRPQQKSKNMN